VGLGAPSGETGFVQRVPTDLVGFIELPAAPRAHDDDRVELVLTNGRRLCFSAAIDLGLLARIAASLDVGTA
jgi:hypothetical protein